VFSVLSFNVLSFNKAHLTVKRYFIMAHVKRIASCAVVALLLTFGLSVGTALAQTGSIEGVVTDAESDNPLPGVNVVIQGTQQGAATGTDGTYEITGVEPGTYTVRASFVGYADTTRQGVEVQANQTTTVDFALEREAAALEEMVVVGYGEQQRRDLTGSVSSVSSENIESIPVATVSEALQGRASGVRATNNVARPGEGAEIRIRGGNSINAGNDPLFVIDGVPGVGDLSTIAPENVESIQILKDASATAIYGSRGANGVVLITTKKGRAGQSRVRFSSSVGFQNPTKKLDLLNAEQFARMVNEVNRQKGRAPVFEDPEALGEGTDWQDQMFQSGLMQTHQLSFSGGGEKTTFLVTGNYLNEEGPVIESGFERYGIRVNLTREMSSALEIGANLSAKRAVTENPNITGITSKNARGRFSAMLYFSPTVPVRNDDGTYNLDSPAYATRLYNPVAYARETQDRGIRSSLLGDVYAQYDILESLNFKTIFGTDVEFYENNLFRPTTTAEGQNVGGEATILNQDNLSWVSTNNLTYENNFSELHQVEITGIVEIYESNTSNQGTTVQQFPTNQLSYNDLSVGEEILTPSSGESQFSLLSYAGRANYTFNDKYLLTLTGRYDGSSRFGAGNKYAFFPSGALAWRVSEEPFMQGQDALSNLKLKVSYGKTGSQEIPSYRSLALLSTVTYPYGTNVSTGFAPSRVANPDLKWETTSQFDLGIEAGFLSQRVRLTADYYYKKTTDLLLNVPLPTTSGFSTSLQNRGSLQNQGVELAIDSENIVGESFSWSSGLNFSTNQSEILDLGPDDEIFVQSSIGGDVAQQYNVLREGEPLGSIVGLETDGLFQSEREVGNSAQPDAQPGDIRLVDQNGDGQINSEDRVILGHANPDFTVSLSNDISYRNFSLSVLLQGRYGNSVLNLSDLEIPPSGARVRNKTTEVLNWWQEPGDQTSIPRLGAPEPNFATDLSVEDASFLRVKNVSLGYDLPSGLLQGLAAQARVYVRGRNLLTFTSYPGYDPEVNVLGSNLTQGIDRGVYPTPRTITAGVDLTF
jgi:TonB-linked SusC/RagA family outer membrane protein